MTEHPARKPQSMPHLDWILLIVARRPDGCWVWPRACFKNGYGEIGIGGKIRKVHRVVYEALVGPVPEGLELDHLCHNPAILAVDA